jgi:hypothetical protein
LKDAETRARVDEKGRVQIGVARPLPDTIAVESETPRFIAQSAGAGRVRLHLSNVVLAEGETLRVYGRDGQAIAFGRELIAPDGGLWTPSVEGDVIAVERSGGAAYTADSILHEYAQRTPRVETTECFQDGSCHTYGDRDALSGSVAQLRYVSNGNAYICSGGLINGGDGAPPMLLTANHCISTTAEAFSLEARWDFTTTSCWGDVRQGTRTYGAQLLATSAATDVTLLQPTSIPGGRWFMGWTTAAQAQGTKLTRLSHPYIEEFAFIAPQFYSTTTVDNGFGACVNAGRPQYIYSRRAVGGVAGGSSGSPVIIDGGYIVGQLLGACPGGLSECSSAVGIVDGALAQSYPLLKPFIDADAAPEPCSACAASATTACLLGNRFKVDVQWRNAFFQPPTSGTARVVRYAENKPEVHPSLGPLTESAYFEMFAPARVELVVKMLSGVGINNKYWIYSAGLTNNEYWITVTDTKTCAKWERYNAHGNFGNIIDLNAFPLP